MIEHILADQLPGDIGRARRVQTLYALLNTTRRSLLPAGCRGDSQERDAWRTEIARLTDGHA